MSSFQNASNFQIHDGHFTDIAGDSTTLSVPGQTIQGGNATNAGRDVHTIINYNYSVLADRSPAERERRPSISLIRRISLWKASLLPPHVTTGDACLQPDPPEGLKYASFSGPDNFNPTQDQYPILIYAGYTYWALSFIDNRMALAILAYDHRRRMVKRFDKTGARYVCRIDVEEDSIRFIGQGNSSVNFRLKDLAIKL